MSLAIYSSSSSSKSSSSSSSSSSSFSTFFSTLGWAFAADGAPAAAGMVLARYAATSCGGEDGKVLNFCPAANQKSSRGRAKRGANRPFVRKRSKTRVFTFSYFSFSLDAFFSKGCLSSEAVPFHISPSFLATSPMVRPGVSPFTLERYSAQKMKKADLEEGK